MNVYRKVASTSMPCLEAKAGYFKLSMRLLYPFGIDFLIINEALILKTLQYTLSTFCTNSNRICSYCVPCPTIKPNMNGSISGKALSQSVDLKEFGSGVFRHLSMISDRVVEICL